MRDARSLIQIIGRAARNVDSKVILYADRYTDSIKKAVDETNRRRNIQIESNKRYGITPTTIVKPIKEKIIDIKDTKHIPKKDIPKMIVDLEIEMRNAADSLDFERAIFLRNKIGTLKQRINFVSYIYANPFIAATQPSQTFLILPFILICFIFSSETSDSQTSHFIANSPRFHINIMYYLNYFINYY